MERVKSKKAIQMCANWLAFCLRNGWDKKDLDALEKLWWEGHNWKTGNLIIYAKRGFEFTCGDCGKKLTTVRPGKHQCDNKKCVQNDPITVKN